MSKEPFLVQMTNIINFVKPSKDKILLLPAVGHTTETEYLDELELANGHTT
jgi:hypothetical protein